MTHGHSSTCACAHTPRTLWRTVDGWAGAVGCHICLMQYAMHHLQMHVRPCRRYQSVGSFDGEPGNDGAGVGGLPLEHTVFTIDDTVPWGTDRRHDDQQQGSDPTIQHQQRGQPSGETSASENASPGPVGKLQLADFHHDLRLLGSIPVCVWLHVSLPPGVTRVQQRMATKRQLTVPLRVPQTSC